MILEAAHGDPLRAQEIEAGIGETWWTRYTVWQHESARVAKDQERKRKAAATSNKRR